MKEHTIQSQGDHLPVKNKVEQYRQNAEVLSGIDLSDMEIHYNSELPVKLHAAAITNRAAIHLASSKDTPLPHEIWHVVQQKQGRVQPTNQKNGFAVNTDPALENEADSMGEKIAYNNCNASIPLQLKQQFSSVDVIQMLDEDGNPDIHSNSVPYQEAQACIAEYLANKSLSARGVLSSQLSKLLRTIQKENSEQEAQDIDKVIFIVQNLPHKDITEKQRFLYYTPLEQELITNSFWNPFLYTSEKKEGYKEFLQAQKNHIFTMANAVEISNKSVLSAFLHEDNIDTLLIKVIKNAGKLKTILNAIPYEASNLEKVFMYSMITRDFNSLSNLLAFYSQLINSLAIPIQQTIQDIAQWSNGESVLSIKLTDSDMHIRGVGVCIVQTSKRVFVVKPESKIFEEQLFSGKHSVAAEFNKLADHFSYVSMPAADDHQEAGMPISLHKASIAGYHLKNSPDNSQGSLAEFVPHKQGPKLKKNEESCIQLGDVILADLFSFLLGLNDLHYENFVYYLQKKIFSSKIMPIMIDADVIVYQDIDLREGRLNLFDVSTGITQSPSPLPAALLKQVEQSSILFPTEEDKRVHIADFLRSVATRFSTPKISRTRVVLFATANLYRLRDWAYMLPIDLNQEIAVLQADGDLATMYEKYRQNGIEEGVSLQNKVLQKFGVDGASISFEGFVSVIKDCQKGLIPFWEIDMAAGTIFQITTTKSYLVAASENLKILNRMEVLIQALGLQELDQ